MIKEEKTVKMARVEREEKEIEAELAILKDEKSIAEAAAENNVYESADQWLSEKSLREDDLRQVQHEHPTERTKDYVMNQNQVNQDIRYEYPEIPNVTLNPNARVSTCE